MHESYHWLMQVGWKSFKDRATAIHPSICENCSQTYCETNLSTVYADNSFFPCDVATPLRRDFPMISFCLSLLVHALQDPGMWSTLEDYVKFCQMLLTGSADMMTWSIFTWQNDLKQPSELVSHRSNLLNSELGTVCMWL